MKPVLTRRQFCAGSLAIAFAYSAVPGNRESFVPNFETLRKNPKAELPEAAQTACVVFTGEKERMWHGINHYMEGRCDRLLVSGYHRDRKDLYRVIREKGIPITRPLSGIEVDSACNTEENAARSKAWLDKYGYKNAILVTADYHMPRSVRLLQSMSGPQVNLFQSPVKTNPSYMTRKMEDFKWTLSSWGLTSLSGCQI